MKRFFDERGFMLLSTIFVTLITSIMAMIILNGTKKISNQNSALKIIAVNLANEQFAYIENIAATENLSGSYNFLGDSDDLKNYYDSGDDKIIPTEFQVITDISGDNNLYTVKITVTWNFNNTDEKLEFEKIIRSSK